MQTLPEYPRPSQSSTREVEFRTLSVQFGNGYQQDIPDGINDMVITWNLVYENVPKTQRDAIVAVLDAARSWDVIRWTDPDGQLINYKMRGSYKESRKALAWTISFQLRNLPGQTVFAGQQYLVNDYFDYASGVVEEFTFTLRGQL